MSTLRGFLDRFRKILRLDEDSNALGGNAYDHQETYHNSEPKKKFNTYYERRNNSNSDEVRDDGKMKIQNIHTILTEIKQISYVLKLSK